MSAVKCFMSGVEGTQHYNACLQAGVTHVLMSYYYLRKKGDMGLVRARKRKNPEINFLIDSGAHTFITDYSKFKSWSKQDFENYVKDYAAWLKANRDYIFAGVELDIDYALNMLFGGGPSSTVGTSIVEKWQQQYFMPLQDYGVDISYVWHTERKLEGWELMCSKFPYVGLPGEMSSEPDFNKYVAIARRYATKIHGFAATKQADFRDWPWYCMTEAHEILTRRGWKKRHELKADDYVLGYANGKSKWEKLQGIHTFDVENVPIVCYDSRTFSARVTENHRWLSYRRHGRNKLRSFEWRETVQLDNDDCLPRKAKHLGPRTRTYSDALVELVAWTWTEGNYNRGKLSISQSHEVNPSKVERIRSALLREGSTFHEWQNDGCTYFGVSGKTKQQLFYLLPGKNIRRDFILSLTEAQLRRFVEISVLGDGFKTPRVRESNTFVLLQKDGRNIENFELACILAGYPVTRQASCNDEGYSMAGVATSNIDFIYPAHAKKRTISYTGKIWCVTTPSHTFLTRCRGKVYWTGNSVDSITWKTCEMYGTLIHWDGHKQILFFDGDKANRVKYRRDFERLGLDADGIINDTNYKEVTKYALCSMRAMESFYEKKYASRLQYYDVRLPGPKAILNKVLSLAGVKRYWANLRPQMLFRNHAGENDFGRVREFLAAISCVQHKDHATLKQLATGLKFLADYFPKLVNPALADEVIFQKEMAMYLAPAPPPALARTEPGHRVATNKPPRAREREEEVTTADLEWSYEGVPI